VEDKAALDENRRGIDKPLQPPGKEGARVVGKL